MGVNSLKVDSAQIKASGLAGLQAVRGADKTWGANYVFASGGLQNDIGHLADVARDAGFTSTNPMPSGGFYVSAADSSTGVFQITVSTGSGSGVFTATPV